MALSDGEVETLLRDLESDRVERKAALADRDRIGEAICAFANDLPDNRQSGVLLVGVNDDGSCSSLPITDDLLLRLADFRSNGNIHPFPSMIVEKRTIAGCEFAVVEVAPSDYPPVRYRGRTWVRVGPRRAIATLEEERRLMEKRRIANLPFDVFTVQNASIDDLDLDLFERTYLPMAVPRQTIQRNSRTVDEQLAALRFMSLDGAPTVLGILTLGRDPRQFIPGAYVQFVRFAGKELAGDIRDQREISGPLPEFLKMVNEIFTAHISISSSVTAGARETKQPDYPIVALQQVIWNAVMHRNYDGTNAPVRVSWFDDRIETQNPGGPFGQVTLANFGQPGVADYRNPDLAEVMKILGYVQRFGLGIELARQELRKNGNPDLDFKLDPSYTLAIIGDRS